MQITNFRDLEVWQRAMQLVVDVYRLTGGYPRNELFVLTSQTRKSAISIPSNIAEGCCRRSTASYINHLSIALGSEAELSTQLECAFRLGFVSAAEVERPLNELSQIGRMMSVMVASLEAGTNRSRSLEKRLTTGD
jgi:four helix bundle protein